MEHDTPTKERECFGFGVRRIQSPAGSMLMYLCTSSSTGDSSRGHRAGGNTGRTRERTAAEGKMADVRKCRVAEKE